MQHLTHTPAKIHVVRWLPMLAISGALSGCPAEWPAATSTEGISDRELLAGEDIGGLAQGLTSDHLAGTTLSTTANLNLRTGPSTDDSILRTMAEGAVVILADPAPLGGFYWIDHAGTLGWASGNYLEPVTGPPPPLSETREIALATGRSAMGFSYWWGHGVWPGSGAKSHEQGTCSQDENGDYAHTGDYGADCSGFVSKVWGIPTHNTATEVDIHGPATRRYVNDEPDLWYTIPDSAVIGGDAMVKSGHMFLVVEADDDGVTTHECRGCTSGCVAVRRYWEDLGAYHTIRRTGW